MYQGKYLKAKDIRTEQNEIADKKNRILFLFSAL